MKALEEIRIATKKAGHIPPSRIFAETNFPHLRLIAGLTLTKKGLRVCPESSVISGAP